tara:strand:- start:214 stop:960 length:747 start_codon:yes stop_codon:yes gene_type:complete
MSLGTIIITGASGKIGKVIIRHLLTKNWDILAITNSENSAENLKQLNNQNPMLKVFSIDLFLRNSHQLIKEKIDKKNGVYAFIHNARDLSSLRVSKDGITDINDFTNEFSLAVTIPYRLIMSIKDKNLKRIIFMSSQYGLVTPNPNLYEDGLLSSPIQYGVSKAAQIHLVKELATRLAKNNILANCIALGGVEGRTNKEFQNSYSKLLPIGRMLKEIEVLPAIDFLLDPLNTATTGATISVDGGWTIQ